MFTTWNFSRIFKEFWFFSRYFQTFSRIFKDFGEFSRIFEVFQGFPRIFGYFNSSTLDLESSFLDKPCLEVQGISRITLEISLIFFNSSTLDLNLKNNENSSLDLKKTWTSRSRSRILVGQGLVWPPYSQCLTSRKFHKIYGCNSVILKNQWVLIAKDHSF